MSLKEIFSLLKFLKPFVHKTKIEPLKRVSDSAYKYNFSQAAEILMHSNFVSNGCGWNGLNKWLVLLLTRLFSFDLREPCHIHDAEWSIPIDQKSPEHRMGSDNDLEMNLVTKIEEYRNHPEKLDPVRYWLYSNIPLYRKALEWAIDNLPQMYHALVAGIGKKHYWHRN